MPDVPFGAHGPALPAHGYIEPFETELLVQHALRPQGPLDMTMRETRVDLHPKLRSVPVWGFAAEDDPASSPGPLLQVDAGQRLLVRWHNGLPASTFPENPNKPAALLPLVTSVVHTDDDSSAVQNRLGAEGGAPQRLDAVPVGWTSVHLHGAHAHPDADGFPDNMVPTGGRQVCAYDNSYDNLDLGLGKVGEHLWYHDHAMNGTRFHVQAGLAGGYLVRDRREVELGLPTSAAEGEIHLLIADRNVDVVDDGVRLLHKTTPDTAEFFGPFTLVNGRVWPRLAARPEVLRLRLLNGSNARAYRLHLVSVTPDDGSRDAELAVEHGRLLIVGADGGLLRYAAPVADDTALVLAPAERMDVLVDLRGLDGTSLYLVNSAEAPFGGSDMPSVDDLKVILEQHETELLHPAADRNLYPWVMRFDVCADAAQGGADGNLIERLRDDSTVLNPNFRRLVHGDPTGPDELSVEGHDHRVILLGETDPAGHLYLQELVEDPFGRIALQLPGEHVPRAYRVDGWTAADTAPSSTEASFYQRVGLRPTLGQWQVWRFVNTTGDTHPIHIHQAQFQPLGEAGGLLTVQVDEGDTQVSLYDPTFRRTLAPLVPASTPTGRHYEPQETDGWKDVIRVDPGNVVNVAVRFDRAGRYVYHCHVLEHEDTEMMRPILVTPVPMAAMPGM
jgi:o-aminophenol oxidase